jgi:Ca2+-transporting ATPase
MADGANNIPEIVTTDLSSIPTLNVRHSNVSPPPSRPSTPPSAPRAQGDSTLLSPYPRMQGRPSLDSRSYSPSPTVVSSNDGASSLNIPPPSPTLSTQSSVHFATSVSLRENKPDERSGYSSLHLLTPSTDRVSTHHRKASNATFTSSHEGHSSFDDTEPDHGSGGYGMVSLQPVRSDPASTVASHTYTHVDTASDRSRSHHAKSDPGISDENVVAGGSPPDVNGVSDSSSSRKSDQENGVISKVELVQDEPVDPHPFQFKPSELASLLDPKNLEALEKLGGIEGLLGGLGTHPTRGLTIRGRGSSDSKRGAGVGASQRHDRVDEHPLSTISVTASHNVSEDGIFDQNSNPHLASLEERRRVFGENVLPQRTSKSLLALMWLALKDKVLVRLFLNRVKLYLHLLCIKVLLSIAAVVSLALGLFQDFGTTLPSGEPPVDWVEGVAIMIAVLIVVSRVALNYRSHITVNFHRLSLGH